MKDIPPVQSYFGATGRTPAQRLDRKTIAADKRDLYSSDLTQSTTPPSGRYQKWMAWLRERSTRLSRSRRGRRRYRGVFFKGKSLYVRGESGHVYDQRFLRTKHRAKILRLSYTL